MTASSVTLSIQPPLPTAPPGLHLGSSAIDTPSARVSRVSEAATSRLHPRGSRTSEDAPRPSSTSSLGGGAGVVVVTGTALPAADAEGVPPRQSLAEALMEDDTATAAAALTSAEAARLAAATLARAAAEGLAPPEVPEEQQQHQAEVEQPVRVWYSLAMTRCEHQGSTAYTNSSTDAAGAAAPQVSVDAINREAARRVDDEVRLV